MVIGKGGARQVLKKNKDVTCFSTYARHLGRI